MQPPEEKHAEKNLVDVDDKIVYPSIFANKKSVHTVDQNNNSSGNKPIEIEMTAEEALEIMRAQEMLRQ